MADNAAFASRAQAASRMRIHIGMKLRALKLEVQQRERWQSKYAVYHGARSDAYDAFIREARDKMNMLRDVLAAGRKPCQKTK